MKRKRRKGLLWALSLLLTALSLGTLAGCGLTQASASPQVLAEETKELVDQAKTQERSVYQVIAENIKAIHSLKERVQQAEDPIKLLDQVIRELEKVTKSFEQMAQDEEGIKKDLLKKRQALHRLVDKAQDEISRLKSKVTSLQQELRTISDTNPNIIEYRQRALNQMIKYLEKQIEIWEKFLAIQKAIVIEVQKIDKRVDEFLIVIELNAKVYREALNLLELQRDIREAQSLFAEIPEIERLAREMVSSWEVLDSLIEALLSFSA